MTYKLKVGIIATHSVEENKIMKEVTLEEIFEIRNRLLTTEGKHSHKVSVVQGILQGLYDNTDENPVCEAYNDLYFLTSKFEDKKVIPEVGQVYVIKPKHKRSFREDKITINSVVLNNTTFNNGSEYFTFIEQQDIESCWSLDLLELYNLVG